MAGRKAKTVKAKGGTDIALEMEILDGGAVPAVRFHYTDPATGEAAAHTVTIGAIDVAANIADEADLQAKLDQVTQKLADKLEKDAQVRGWLKNVH